MSTRDSLLIPCSVRDLSGAYLPVIPRQRRACSKVALARRSDVSLIFSLLTRYLKLLFLVARTGIEPVVSALRGRRVKPITLPGHSGQSIVKRTFQQSKSLLRICTDQL